MIRPMTHLTGDDPGRCKRCGVKIEIEGGESAPNTYIIFDGTKFFVGDPEKDDHPFPCNNVGTI